MALLSAAERPLVIAGGTLEPSEARQALVAAAECHHLPVAPTFKHQEIFDNESPLFAGHLGFKIPRPLISAFAEADLILAIGTRLSDVPTQGDQLPKAPQREQPLIHVYPDPAVIGRVFRTDLGLACDPTAFLRAISLSNAAVPEARRAWAAKLRWVSGNYRGYEIRHFEDGLDFGAVVKPLADQVPTDAILVTDAGNFSSWVHSLWPWDGSQSALGAVGAPWAWAFPAPSPPRSPSRADGDRLYRRRRRDDDRQ